MVWKAKREWELWSSEPVFYCLGSADGTVTVPSAGVLYVNDVWLKWDVYGAVRTALLRGEKKY